MRVRHRSWFTVFAVIAILAPSLTIRAGTSHATLPAVAQEVTSHPRL